jgi:hypothetical protein
MGNKVLKEFDTIMRGDYGNLILYSAVVGIGLSDKVPTPNALIGRFTLNKIKGEYDRGDISFFEFKERSDKALTLYENLWWGGVLATMFFTKGDVYQKAKIGGILVVSGIIASMLVPAPDMSANALVDSSEDNNVNFEGIQKVSKPKSRLFI